MEKEEFVKSTLKEVIVLLEGMRGELVKKIPKKAEVITAYFNEQIKGIKSTIK